MGEYVGSGPMPNTELERSSWTSASLLFAESRESQWNENVALYVQLIQNTEVCKNTKHYESKCTSIYDSELLK